MRTRSRLAGRSLGALLVFHVISGCASGGTGASGAGSTVRPSEAIQTSAGLVRGTAGSRPGVRAYLGIPYAAPPVGEFRWRAPVPLEGWTNVRSAERFAPSCMQGPNTPFGPWTAEFLLLGPVSEDCLYLNVWTAARSNERRPVLVYVYGGGFSSGSGDVPVYDGAALAEKGLVVVNMNYRVGALGFLAYPELTAESGVSGNYGLLDQVAALEWVRENIGRFGGDPSRVMVAGQSAGAMSVYLLTASPMAKALFQRAAIESGPGGLAAMGVASGRSVVRARADAERDGLRYAGTLGAKNLAELRRLPASRFVSRAAPGDTSLRARIRFGPVIDGRFLVENPAETFAAGRQNDVPTITGLNADEGSASPTYGRATAAQFRDTMSARYGERAARILATYPAATDEEARRSQIESGRDAGVAGVQQLLIERAKSSRTPAYGYYFDHAIPWPDKPQFGAFHTSEVPYVFGTLDKLRRPWTETDRRLSATMMSYWTNFATTGDPNGPLVPTWPAFSAERPTLLRIGDRIEPMEPMPPQRLELFTR
ncbi:MAG: carboxylesterase/lipase family protein [Gemmatimonadaceae bacterium]